MTETNRLFLDDDELAELTGRKLRRLQIDALRSMLIPFRVNAIGRPVVTRAAIVGTATAAASNDAGGWTPRQLSRR